MAFGYDMLRGRDGAEGFARAAAGGRQALIRGMRPGEPCALYVLKDQGAVKTDEQPADSQGQAALSADRDGALFVVSGGRVRLWQGGEDNYLRACEYMARERAERQEEREAAADAEAQAALKRDLVDIQREIPETGADPSAQAEATPEKPQAEEAWTLRSPGAGEPVDALPALIWPREAQSAAAYFAQYPPCAPFSAPGWRFVRTPAGVPSVPFLLMGFLARDARVRAILYALPGSRHQAASMLPGYRFQPGQDGYDYWVLRQDFS